MSLGSSRIGTTIETVDQLEAALSDPLPIAVEAMSKIRGDVLVLGINGKMGPTLAMMAHRASKQAGVKRRIIGVSRFGANSTAIRRRLENQDIETVQCDLLDRQRVAELPDAQNVIYMAGMKFGSSADTGTTWAMNAYLPGIVCERYAGSHIAAFSTGNVYGLTSTEGGGSCETDELNPVGEYAMSCLGRERVLQYFSGVHGTKIAIIRLNYAVEFRYGVIVDLALKVKRCEPINLEMGHFNAIWQADANAMTLAALSEAASPPFVLNIAGPERLSVRAVAKQLGEDLGIEPIFTGQEQAEALLSCGRKGYELYGPPSQPADAIINSVAHWIKQGGEVINKPTKFESRDGRF